jgi:alginate O-acetyltransferase complex protein AlgI
MAIGLGKMMGFTFPENFNQPYRAKNITEFWHRWHITLSNWFRDYLYFPLGGNRKGPLRTYFNLFLVFIFCGLWHGAAYTFLAWGLFHGVMLTIERLLLTHSGFKPQGLLWILPTIVLLMISWVIFRSDSIASSGTYLLAMAGLGEGVENYFDPGYYLTNDRIFILCVGWLIALLPFDKLASFSILPANHLLFFLSRRALSITVLLLVTIELAGKAFNPFIYFRF